MTEIELVVVLLALFGVKHFICDFLLQFHYMVEQKAIYGAGGGIEHALCHAAGTWFILIPFFGILGFIPALVDGIIHYHVDWSKQQLTRGLTPADRKFWVWLGLDQALHYLTYIAIIGWIVGVF
jgi:hypothetical protein